MTKQPNPKDSVRDFWDAASCGEVYAEGDTIEEQFRAQERARYALEPYIASFAGFRDGGGKDILEVGVGMGADHIRWARQAPRSLAGVDLTPRAVEWTRQRLALEGLSSDLHKGDAEHLPFLENSFNIVYSWGVLHHTPDTAAAFAEVLRVLRPGGVARIMIYHSRSVVGAILWTRYALLAKHPRRTLKDVYAHHLESPGTQASTVDEAKTLAAGFSTVSAWPQLSFGDLMQGQVGQQHGGRALDVAKKEWPRALIQRALPWAGLMLLIEAHK